jgi:hypothetical protein
MRTGGLYSRLHAIQFQTAEPQLAEPHSV